MEHLSDILFLILPLFCHFILYPLRAKATVSSDFHYKVPRMHPILFLQSCGIAIQIFVGFVLLNLYCSV
jgi:hypothetical protein